MVNVFEWEVTKSIVSSSHTFVAFDFSFDVLTQECIQCMSKFLDPLWCSFWKADKGFHLGSVYFTCDILATLSWSYCAGSRRFGLVAWRNTNKKVTWSGKRCFARGVMLTCYSCYANGCRFDSCLADFHLVFFFAFFQAPLRCYL